MIVRIILSIIMLAMAVYNISVYSKIKIYARIEKTHQIGFVSLIVILMLAYFFIFERSIYNILLAGALMFFYYSSVLARGISDKGIVDKSYLFSLAKLYEWKDINELKIVSKAGNFDLNIETKNSLLKQSYENEYEEKIKNLKNKYKI